MNLHHVWAHSSLVVSFAIIGMSKCTRVGPKTDTKLFSVAHHTTNVSNLVDRFPVQTRHPACVMIDNLICWLPFHVLMHPSMC